MRPPKPNAPWYFLLKSIAVVGTRLRNWQSVSTFTQLAALAARIRRSKRIRSQTRNYHAESPNWKVFSSNVE